MTSRTESLTFVYVLHPPDTPALEAAREQLSPWAYVRQLTGEMEALSQSNMSLGGRLDCSRYAQQRWKAKAEHWRSAFLVLASAVAAFIIGMVGVRL